MKALATSLGAILAAAALGLSAAQDRPAKVPDEAPPPAQAARPADGEPDVQGITALIGSFIKAFNAKDAAALGDLFMPDAEVEDEDGEITRGRDAIVARFSAAFQDNDVTLALDSESLRFLGADLAIEEGTASLSGGADAPPRTNRYSVIYARQGGRWLHARIRDEPENDIPAHERLRELGWLLGDWVNESDDNVVSTTCKWSDDGNYLIRNFDVKVEGRIALHGTQRIGWDPKQGQFRTWVFDDSGGFADGLISHDGDSWVVRGSGVRPDGQSVSYTTSMTLLEKDRQRWEILDRTVGDESAPEMDAFYLVRRPPNPGE